MINVAYASMVLAEKNDHIVPRVVLMCMDIQPSFGIMNMTLPAALVGVIGSSGALFTSPIKALGPHR